ncbi:hypothetical protein [Dongshaea marina]|nr:hypothetical protein [Dongshaea marina]
MSNFTDPQGLNVEASEMPSATYVGTVSATFKATWEVDGGQI